MPRARTAVLVPVLIASVLAAWLLTDRARRPDAGEPVAHLTRRVLADAGSRPPAATTAAEQIVPSDASRPGRSGAADASPRGPPGSRPASSPSASAVAEQALRRPAGPERRAALSSALETWILSDPAAVNAWAVEHLHDQADWDLAASLLIRHTDTVHRATQVAREWAESIHDGDLRARALEQVAREWAGQDAEAARTYVASTPSLDTAQRAAVLSALTPRPPET